MAPGELSHILSSIDTVDKNILVGIDSSDDASVYALDEHKALVQTLDVITPVVDNPYMYGQIAAANSLSDVFAMGGDVLTAMNIVGFDGCHHPKSVLKEMLEGGQSKVKECGGMIIGGHTIETPEMIYGLSVTGLVHPQKIYRNNTPRIGDVLILTKPIGMGVLSTAIKADMLELSSIKKVAAIMAQLNHKASILMRRYSVSACTDVTGFGLFGHAYEMSDQKVSIAFDFEAIPILEEAKDLASMGIIPAGTYANKLHVNPHVSILKEYADEIFVYDAQTSGGLLISVSQKDAPLLLQDLQNDGYTYSSIIAEIITKEDKSLILR